MLLSNTNCKSLDLSQSRQGAGGVGGLLAAVHGTNVYYPCHDANGNITQYVNSSSGTEVARYDYAAFGNEFHSSGDLADDFVFRFSTKYTDNETELVYYGYRCLPDLPSDLGPRSQHLSAGRSVCGDAEAWRRSSAGRLSLNQARHG